MLKGPELKIKNHSPKMMEQSSSVGVSVLCAELLQEKQQEGAGL